MTVDLNIIRITIGECFFFIPMGQIRGKGRGEGFTGAWSIQFNKKKNPHSFSDSRQKICKNNYIGEMFFISMGQVGGEGFTVAWSMFRVGKKYK